MWSMFEAIGHFSLVVLGVATLLVLAVFVLVGTTLVCEKLRCEFESPSHHCKLVPIEAVKE